MAAATVLVVNDDAEVDIADEEIEEIEEDVKQLTSPAKDPPCVSTIGVSESGEVWLADQDGQLSCTSQHRSRRRSSVFRLAQSFSINLIETTREVLV